MPPWWTASLAEGNGFLMLLCTLHLPSPLQIFTWRLVRMAVERFVDVSREGVIKTVLLMCDRGQQNSRIDHSRCEAE